MILIHLTNDLINKIFQTMHNFYNYVMAEANTIITNQ